MSLLEEAGTRVVEGVEDRAALENARLINEARASLLRSGTAVTVDDIVEVTGRSRAAVRKSLTRWRSAGRIATVTHDGQTWVPTVQLTAALDDVDPLAEDVVTRLVDHGLDGWAVWDWFETPNTWLGGLAPAEAVRSQDRAGLERAVTGLGQE